VHSPLIDGGGGAARKGPRRAARKRARRAVLERVG
jgi:hypothetical protein